VAIRSKEPPAYTPRERGGKLSREWVQWYTQDVSTQINKMLNEIIGGSGQIVVTDNDDNTVTLSIDDGYLTASVLGTANEIDVTDNGDGTITVSIDPDYLPVHVLETINQVLVTDNADGTITLSTPQDIHTGASPIFAGLTINGDATINGDIKGLNRTKQYFYSGF